MSDEDEIERLSYSIRCRAFSAWSDLKRGEKHAAYKILTEIKDEIRALQRILRGLT